MRNSVSMKRTNHAVIRCIEVNFLIKFGIGESGGKKNLFQIFYWETSMISSFCFIHTKAETSSIWKKSALFVHLQQTLSIISSPGRYSTIETLLSSCCFWLYPSFTEPQTGHLWAMGFIGVYHIASSANSWLATWQTFCSLPRDPSHRPAVLWAVLWIAPLHLLPFLLLKSACQVPAHGLASLVSYLSCPNVMLV